MIALEHLYYRYQPEGSWILKDVNLEIQDGEFVLVVGESGSGKSTLLRCLNGLVPHFYGGEIAGTVTVADKDVIQAEPKGMSSTVGFCFQEPEAQFVVDTVESELAFAMENHNLSQAVMRKRVEEVLDQLSIAHLRHRRISTLSGGEKQRVAIGAVLTLQPEVLVLDEPTSQLDPQAAEEVLNVLERLNADLGLTIVLCEHRLERVLQYADRVVYLPGNGQSLVDGTPDEVMAQCPLAPPLVVLGKSLGWRPLPLTIKDARRYARKVDMAEGSGRDLSALGTRKLGDLAIDAQNVRYAYGNHWALRGVDLAVERGKIVALMGRNGSGKTTLLKHLVGLLKPARGNVAIMGRSTDGADVSDLARHVGYVPQNPDALLYADSVRDELLITRRNHGLDEKGVDELLTMLGLLRYADVYPRDLSVGERQRVALGAILAAEPELVLLDEPTRGVDYAQKQVLVAFLRELKKEGRTVILSTHDVELAAACADRVVILGDGEKVVDGPTREVMTESMVFSSQINKLFRDRRMLLVEDVLGALG